MFIYSRFYLLSIFKSNPLDGYGTRINYKNSTKIQKNHTFCSHLAIILCLFPTIFDGWRDGGLSGMSGMSGFSGIEENKKSGGGDVRAEALAWDGEWDKA